MKKWVIKNKQADFTKMASSLDINANLAKILVNRDINTPRKAKTFLEANVDMFYNFDSVKNINTAMKLLKEKVDKKEKILIYGDYDVDGVSSTTILYKGLKLITDNVNYYIPHREHEGYGLNIDTLKKLVNQNIDLIITTDNGITSVEEIEFLREHDISVIVLDHHEPILDETDKMVLPKANAIIDPKMLDCEYPFKLMCAGGLAYRFITHFFEKFSYSLINKEELLVFSMIATICDIVDLYEDNRIIVKNGLNILNNNKSINKGLYKLLEKNNIQTKLINDYDIGFIVGPCINAVGRLDRASIAVDLFVCDDDIIVDNLASNLVELNIERKRITKESFERVLQKVIDNKIYDDDIIIVYDELTHESIAGIVAGRIKDYFYKPTVVLTKSGDVAKGSARSIQPCDIYKLLSKSRDLFIRFGGHSMAAGLSLSISNIESLRKDINSNSTLTEKDFIEVIKIENSINLEEITINQYEMLEKLKPYGKGNREPLFGTKKVNVSSIRVIADKNTTIFTFKNTGNYKSVKGIYFGNIDYFTQILKSTYKEEEIKKILMGNLYNINLFLDIIYSIQLNEYNNNISVQTIIKDMRISN